MLKCFSFTAVHRTAPIRLYKNPQLNKMTFFTISTAQKMKFPIKETVDLVTFTEKMLNRKLHFFVQSSIHEISNYYELMGDCNKNMQMRVSLLC